MVHECIEKCVYERLAPDDSARAAPSWQSKSIPCSTAWTLGPVRLRSRWSAHRTAASRSANSVGSQCEASRRRTAAAPCHSCGRAIRSNHVAHDSHWSDDRIRTRSRERRKPGVVGSCDAFSGSRRGANCPASLLSSTSATDRTASSTIVGLSLISRASPTTSTHRPSAKSRLARSDGSKMVDESSGRTKSESSHSSSGSLAASRTRSSRSGESWCKLVMRRHGGHR